MAFGIKIRKLETSKPYTLEELFEAIKNHPFTAGQPSMTKHGLGWLITFPPIDRNNQIWVTPSGMKAPFTKFTITKNEVAGMDNMAKNMGISALTGGWSRMTSTFGKNAKASEELVVKTAEELNALGL